MSTWREGLARPTGREFFSKFNINSYNDFTGEEIFFDTDRLETTVSPLFFGIWKNKHKNINAMINNGAVLTSIEIANNIYPIHMRLVNDFTPLILGQDFFTQNSWTHRAGENIKTPTGDILVDHEMNEGRSIDVKLCEQVHQAEEIGKENGKDKKGEKENNS